MGLYFEDLVEGRAFLAGPRRVTAAEVGAFAELSGDRNPIHLDAEAARTAGFSGPVAHGILGLAVATGLASQLELTRGTLVALVGVQWRFRRPVYLGDEVTLHLRVSSRRDTAHPRRGLVTLSVELRNQEGAVVQEGEWVELLRKRPAAGGST